jgi:hypothetical protein
MKISAHSQLPYSKHLEMEAISSKDIEKSSTLAKNCSYQHFLILNFKWLPFHYALS